MRLLLHTCCGPCLIYPLERLKGKHFTVSGFFYNPNIHNLAEYVNRRRAVEHLSRSAVLDVVYPQYLPTEFFRAVNLNEAKPARCLICWKLRLLRTAAFAKENGFDGFSTTLLVSPYQDQESVRRIGLEASSEAGIEFYYEDFRPGFKRAHDLVKEQGIYCQKYCGCLYSEMERYAKCGKSQER